MSTAPITDPSVIKSDELYPIGEAKRRLGWGEAAMRTARRNGLKIKYAGGRAFVLGAEMIRHITETGKDTK